MDSNDFSGTSIYVVFGVCLAAFGFIYFEIFHQTENPKPAPVVQSVVR